MRRAMLKSLLIVGFVLSASVLCSAQLTSGSTASLSSTSAQDSELLKLLETTKIQKDALEQKVKLLEDRLAVKDEIIRAKEGTIQVRDEQLKLALSANQDRAAVNTGDARMLAACEQQLSRADAEINRLRNPGFFRELFSPKTLFYGGIGYAIGRGTK